MSVRGYLVGLAVARGIEKGSLNASMLREACAPRSTTRKRKGASALRPVVAAEPERFVIRSGKAVPTDPAPLSP